MTDPTWHTTNIDADAHADRTAADLTALMLRVQHGDRDTFAVLYDQLSALVYGVIVKVVRDTTIAEDVAQEAFVELWSTAARFDQARGSVATWAATIARRRAVDRVRREESQRQRVTALAARRVDDPPAVAETVVESIEAGRVRQAMLLLPPDQRQVVQLAFLDGHSHSTIADELRLPLGTVKSRVRGALQRLAAALKEES
jgi:RNA polymerase sigma-70 factor, ECF subfamily